MAELQKRTLTEWLDDLCVRFIINLPQEELESVERICFQVEEAQWFYEDFVRPLDPTLPSMNLKKFCMVIFQHCPLLSEFSQYHHFAAFSEFLAYKQRVPVRGAIMLNDTMDQVVLVKGWKKGARWSFPRGKINKDESDLDCAIREVYEETGYDLHAAGLAGDPADAHAIEVSMREQHMKLFVFRGVPMDAEFEPRTRKEISKIDWYKLSELPTVKQMRQHQNGEGVDAQQQSGKFYMVAPFLGPLKHWIRQQRKRDRLDVSAATMTALPTDDEEVAKHAISGVEATLLRENHVEHADGHFSNLLAGLRSSSGPAEPTATGTTQPQAPVRDPAAALKRMLSVGQSPAPLASGPPPVRFNQPPTLPSGESSGNVLLDMLRGGPKPSPHQVDPQTQQIPMTPFEQITTTAMLPRTPPHHHHVRPQPDPAIQQAAQPPYFPYSQGSQHAQPHAQFPPRLPTASGNPSRAPPIATQKSPEHTSQLLSLFRSNAREDGSAAPSGQPPFGSGSPMPTSTLGPMTQETNVVPQASRLPAPKLTAHTMSLLNAFKSPVPSQMVPATRPVPLSLGHMSELSASDTSPPGSLPLRPYDATQKSSQAKPTHSQQASLLDLFHQAPRGPQNNGQGPVELAARQSPLAHFHNAPVKPDLGLHMSADSHRTAQNMTSATVTGPLHPPNLAYLRQQTGNQAAPYDTENTPRSQHPTSSTAWGVAASGRLPTERTSFSAEALSPASAAPEVAESVEDPTMFSYGAINGMEPHDSRRGTLPVPDASHYARTGSLPLDQKDALLSLLTGNPLLPGATAKPSATSGVLSPISPLPGNGKSKTSSVQGSPGMGADAKSRVSSIASLAGNVVPGTINTNATIQRSPHAAGPVPVQMSGQEANSKQGRVGSPSVPVDKSVLLGFLQNVAKGA